MASEERKKKIALLDVTEIDLSSMEQFLCNNMGTHRGRHAMAVLEKIGTLGMIPRDQLIIEIYERVGKWSTTDEIMRLVQDHVKTLIIEEF